MGLIKDNYIKVTRPQVEEDAYGDLTVTSQEDIASFWGSVTEIKPRYSDLTSDNGRVRFTRTIEIIADDRDTDSVDIDDHLVIDGTGYNWEVTNIFESDWKWSRTIIAQIKN